MVQEEFFVIGTYKKSWVGYKCKRCVELLYLKDQNPPPYTCDGPNCGKILAPHWSNSNKLLSAEAEYESHDGIMVIHYTFGDEPAASEASSSR
ncbi:uncharacterized protein BKCO1_4000021 [Diplodia corticola]|uniref:Uncharacterized protein n=1 Tax=Diplodia corticola TaxID=236234 RepID=A0A1J9QUP2_9PEZI|nr:uncharacterized protein BKCO1_4000021 [Diplodia corticola]OJD32160.1 hypothetical protein BKCO1_4000021 [Diplodia corticola]